MSFFIIIRGSLGSGKSTLAKKLSKLLNAKYFSVDSILEKYDLTEEKEEGYISQKSFITANKIVTKDAKKALEKNISVIFDGNFYWKSQIFDLIERLKFPHFVFTLKVPLRVCIKRDNKRRKSCGKDAVKAVYRKSTEFDYGISINANKSVEECVRIILKKIEGIVHINSRHA